MMQYTVRAAGGTTFELDLPNGEIVRFESGKIDASGQWVETEDVEDRARIEGNIPINADLLMPF